MAKFEIYIDRKGEFRFRLKAGNGLTILASEGYKSKNGCMNGIEAVIKNSQKDINYERLRALNGKTYFNLKSANGAVIGTSQTYESTSSLENGIASVKKNAPIATVELI